MLKINPTTVALKGMALRASFELYNPNENLAVIFELGTSVFMQKRPKTW